jgi:hypothetical protein
MLHGARHDGRDESARGAQHAAVHMLDVIRECRR